MMTQFTERLTVLFPSLCVANLPAFVNCTWGRAWHHNLSARSARGWTGHVGEVEADGRYDENDIHRDMA